MFLLRKPTSDEIDRFIGRQVGRPFSYAEVGATRRGEAPDGYVVDHYRVLLGKGEETWRRAVKSLREWEMFNLGWVQLAWPSAPISIGTIVATVVAHFGFYSLNASRIVYVMDETESVRRFGFAYGTLQDHSERGEERFSVEWNTADNTVHYDLFASSKPNANIVKWTKPLARTLQRRFAVESVAAMQRAIK